MGDIQRTIQNELTLVLREEFWPEAIELSSASREIYRELKKIAIYRAAMEGNQSSMTPTILVSETYLKMLREDSKRWRNRKHFYGAAAEAMRRILIDRARYHRRERRIDAKNQFPLSQVELPPDSKSDELVKLDDALQSLESNNETLAQIVKLKFFAGLSVAEIASLTDMSARTVNRKWESARAWLLMEMGKDS